MKLLIAVVGALLLSGVATAQEPDSAFTPKSLEVALAGAKADGAEADKLAERIRAYFGGSEVVAKGAPPQDRRTHRRVGGRGSESAGQCPGHGLFPTPCCSRCR